jgi:Fe-Mn family superoxide dismutase
MEIFTPKNFNIPKLNGISETNIEEHLKLYKGYVLNTNLIFNKIKEYKSDPEKNSFILGELQRRLGFEFNGMRNHEYYFRAFEGGPKMIKTNGKLEKLINKEWVTFDQFLKDFKFVALTRGIGWAMLYYDNIYDKLIINWVDEQHIGHLIGLRPILCLDMWEHAYVYDYPTSAKKEYIESFFKNINWEVIENNLN